MLTFFKNTIKATIGFLESLLPVENENGKDLSLSKEDKLTIRGLERKIRKQFEKDMEDYRGDYTIQFPMVFDILLCPDDYKRYEKGIPGILPELVSSFYGIIKRERDKVQGTVVKNTNRYWLFTYGPGDLAKDENGNTIQIPKGEVVVQAALYGEDVRAEAKDLSDGATGDYSSTNSRSSVTSISSLSEGTAFNIGVLDGGYMHSNSMASFNYDPNLPTDLNTIKQSRSSSKKGYALLSWISLNTMEKSKQDFQMLEDMISISGTSDTRENPLGIMKIKDGLVKQDHVQIRHIENGFQICAYYNDVSVAGKKLEVSEKQNPKWVALPDKCSIVIANSVTVSFRAL